MAQNAAAIAARLAFVVAGRAKPYPQASQTIPTSRWTLKMRLLGASDQSYTPRLVTQNCVPRLAILEVAGRAKPYQKVILERRKHLFESFGGCELHSGPPIALLPTAHASCLHPQAPQSACQTIPKSNFGASKTPFRITRGV